MSNNRPCLSCGQDGAVDASHCARCGAELRAFSQTSTARVLAAGAVSVAARRGLVLAVAATATILLALLAVRVDWDGPGRSSGPTWRKPASVEDWGREALTRAGLHVTSIKAVSVTDTPSPRRVLLVDSEGRLSAARSVRAVGRLLVEAREGGERTGIHVVQLTMGDLPPVTVMAGEARRLMADDGLAAWLAARDLPLEDVDDEGVASKAPAAPTEGAGATDAVPPPTEEATAPIPRAPVLEAAASPATEDPTEDESPPAEEGAPGVPPVTVSSAPRSAPQAAAVTAGTAAVQAPAMAPAGRPPVPVRLLRGVGPPYPVEVNPGASRVTVLRAQIHPSARRELILAALTISSLGTASEVDDIGEVHLFRDLDRDGERGDGDPRLGRATSFESDDGTVTWDGLDVAFGGDGTPLYLLVAFEFPEAPNSVGGSVTVAVPAASSLVVREKATGATCPVAGAPLQGASVTVVAAASGEPAAPSAADEP